MFQDLDATLQAVFDDDAAPADLRNAEVSFEAPDKAFKPDKLTVNLFLHEVAENRTLRDDARSWAQAGDGFTSTLPPIRVDCTYLVTAWSPASGGTRTADEHRLLGLALAWLGRFHVVEDRFLRGSLKNPAQPYPLPSVVAQQRDPQGAAHLWSALGVSPRPTFTVTVTIAMTIADKVEEYGRVERIQVQAVSVTDPALTGRILDSTLDPVRDVSVRVVETGATATTGASGDFAFPVPPGTYTLRVERAGLPDVEVSRTYAADAQVHTIVLPA